MTTKRDGHKESSIFLIPKDFFRKDLIFLEGSQLIQFLYTRHLLNKSLLDELGAIRISGL